LKLCKYMASTTAHFLVTNSINAGARSGGWI
jgi:hypothetical protein